jgi:hypothetical protein
MGRRVLPALFVAIAAVADLQGSHNLAGDALLAALPFAAVAALVTFGDYIDSPGGVNGLQSLCSGVIVALLVVSCAVRNAAAHGVPPLGVSSLIAVVALFTLKGVLAGRPGLRRLSAFWPAKP